MRESIKPIPGLFRERKLTRRLALAALVVPTLILTTFLLPAISVGSSAEEVNVFELGTSATPPQALASGSLTRRGEDGPIVDEDVNGYRVRGRGIGAVELPLRLELEDGDRAKLQLWVYGGPLLEASVGVRATDGSVRAFGGPGTSVWAGKTLDVTDVARGGRFVLSVSARNDGDDPALFLDRIVLAREPSDSRASAPPALVGLWLGLIVAAALVALGRLRRHWLLPLLVTLGGSVLWLDVRDVETYRASPAWRLARQAGWLDLQTGLVSGSFGEVSALTVQLFHALMPLTGEGATGAAAASAIIGVAALVALYALGNRVAGPLAGVVTVLLALLVHPFREAVTQTDSATTLVLAAALFVYALHASLAETNLTAVVFLAGAGALAVLANAVWLPGVILCIPLCALLYGSRGQRLRLAAMGLLLLAVFLAPNRASVADQNDGNAIADLDARATAARNLEGLLERGAAPPEGNVGLGTYIFSDRPAAEVVGNLLLGAVEAVGSFVKGGELAILAGLGFALSLLGALYLLLVSRLRSLLLLPLLVALPELYFAAEDVSDPFIAGAALWPAFLVGGGLLAYVLFTAYGERLAEPLRRYAWFPFRARELPVE